MVLAKGSKIAIIGSGISGITASYYLQDNFEIDLYEKDSRIGGHTNTISVNDLELGEIGVDTGFIVLNDRTYPTLHKFFNSLGVAVRFSDMSFSVNCQQSGIQYASHSVRGIIGNYTNFLKPSYYPLILDFKKFWNESQVLLNQDSSIEYTVGDFVKENKYSTSFVNNFIVPMGAAIWSSPDANILKFPLKFFLRFFKNHGMLSYSDQPKWQTVVGGSWKYLQQFSNKFKGQILLNQNVESISFKIDNVEIRSNGNIREYDHVVLATPADITAKYIANYNSESAKLLNSWTYQDNYTVLHTDQSWLPKCKAVQASWNYNRSKNSSTNSAVSITYDMNRLQGLNSKTKYCVTLNPDRPIQESKIIYKINYRHPQYTLSAEKAQIELNLSNTADPLLSICGAYRGFGFHEDGCLSGYQTANKIIGMLR
jgi:predicted NAD/FAD-binding protein